MKEFIFWFKARKLGAIGVFGEIGPFVGVGKDRDTALENALARAHVGFDLLSNIPLREEDVTGWVGR